MFIYVIVYCNTRYVRRQLSVEINAPPLPNYSNLENGNDPLLFQLFFEKHYFVLFHNCNFVATNTSYQNRCNQKTFLENQVSNKQINNATIYQRVIYNCDTLFVRGTVTRVKASQRLAQSKAAPEKQRTFIFHNYVNNINISHLRRYNQPN